MLKIIPIELFVLTTESRHASPKREEVKLNAVTGSALILEENRSRGENAFALLLVPFLWRLLCKGCLVMTFSCEFLLRVSPSNYREMFAAQSQSVAS